MVGEGEEPPEVEEAEAEEEEVVAEAVALAYVTVLVSLAYEWSQENGFCSAAGRAEGRTGLELRPTSPPPSPPPAPGSGLRAPSRSTALPAAPLRPRCARAALGAPGSLPGRRLWGCP